jgi:predicted alpha/beta-hydrolase family hydrolase
MHQEPIKIALAERKPVSGLLLVPDHPAACYVMAHGAGAGIMHPFMESVATGLANRNIATLRYQFPYMEQGSKRTNRPEVARATVRAAVEAASGLMPGIPLIAGGKSFGGRMTSQAQAEKPLPAIVGLVFFGFPLHPAGKPSDVRAEHLAQITIPMLFLQGTRDGLASMKLLVPMLASLGKRATLSQVEDADHSFHVPARSGRTDDQVMGETLDVMAEWIGDI